MRFSHERLCDVALDAWLGVGANSAGMSVMSPLCASKATARHRSKRIEVAFASELLEHQRAMFGLAEEMKQDRQSR